MNKYQEAFANVKRACIVPFLGRKPIDICGVSLDRLKELVERATPKKPIKDRSSKIRYVQTYVCLSCGKSFSGEVSNFCYHCGQAIDWGEEE